MNYIGVFQGGGVKGIAHIGALIALEERGFKCVKASGTSVGAIIASLVIAGYHGVELKKIVESLDLTLLTEKTPILKAVKQLGIYDSSPLEVYLGKLLARKNINTYLDLKIENDYKLKVLAFDLTKRKRVILPNDFVNYQINPDQYLVAKSVVMSASYPLFYQPYKIKKSIIIDGGIANNFPVEVFSTENLPIIAFQLNGEKDGKKPNKINNVIRICLPKIRKMNFKVDLELKNQLIQCGYVAGKKFLNEFFTKI